MSDICVSSAGESLGNITGNLLGILILNNSKNLQFGTKGPILMARYDIKHISNFKLSKLLEC